MAGKTPRPTGTACTLANVFAFVAIIAFVIAAVLLDSVRRGASTTVWELPDTPTGMHWSLTLIKERRVWSFFAAALLPDRHRPACISGAGPSVGCR